MGTTNKTKIESTQSEFNDLLNWFLSKKSERNNNSSDYNSFLNTLSKNICFQYKNLKKNKIKNLKKKKIKFKNYNSNFLKSFDLDTKKKNLTLINKVKKLKKYILFFIVHGSYSTNDYIKNWSDFDSIIVVKDIVLKNSNLLSQFRKEIIILEKFLQEIDRFQHHGFLVMTEFDLNFYSSQFLPLNVLEHSRVVVGKKIISLKYYRDKKFWIKKLFNLNKLFKESYRQGFLRHHPYNNQYLYDNYKDMNTMYQMKYFLALIMFVPCLYLECVGEPTYKKYSFQKLNNLNLGIDYEIINKASVIREKFKSSIVKSNRIPRWLPKILKKNYFKRAYELSKSLKKSLNYL